MNTKTKFLVRLLVMVAVLAWPAVETWRLMDTQQRLKEAQALQSSVQTKYEAARAKHVQVAGPPDASSTPSAK